MTIRAGRVSDARVATWLADLEDHSTHLALMFQDPYLVSDPLTAEIAVARVAVSWATSGRLLRNVNPLVWAGVPAGMTVVAIAGFDAAFNGSISFSAPIDPLPFPAGGGLSIAANEFFTGVDA